jgi:hypothetical protein
MNKITGLFFIFIGLHVQAQQIAKAKDVQLILTAGTIINASGGISFAGSSNFKNDGTVNLRPSGIKENWLDSTSTGVLDNASTGTVQFTSDSVQSIYGNSIFYNVVVNNDSAVSLLNDVEVKNQLFLNKGLVNTNGNIIIVSNPALTAIQSSSNYANSWVNGKLTRSTNTAGVNYLFPIGKWNGIDSTYAPIMVDKFNANGANYTAEYFKALPMDYLNFLNPPIDHISQIEYWEVLASNFIGGSNDADAKLSLSWRAGSAVNNNAAVRDSLLIAQYTSFPRWEATGGGFPAVVTGTSTAGFVKHNAYIGNFSNAEKQFTLASRSLFNILPYKIIYWDAIVQNAKIGLQFEIAFEQEVKQYTIEKSVNGLQFTQLLTTPSLKLATATYAFADFNPMPGWNYYRLLVKDEQGNTRSAGIRKVWYGDAKARLQVFPNPTQNIVQVKLPKYDGNSYIQLYNTTGALIATYQPTTGTTIQINVAKLTAGVYVLKLIQGEKVQQFKFSKE